MRMKEVEFKLKYFVHYHKMLLHFSRKKIILKLFHSRQIQSMYYKNIIENICKVILLLNTYVLIFL